MKKLALHWQIIIGLVLGVIWALLASYFGWTRFTLNWIDPFGKIFINLLKLIAVPLVFFSIIKGIASLGDIGSLGRLGIKTLSIYLLTTVVAVSIGLLLVNSIQPGKYMDEGQRLENRKKYERFVSERDGVDFLDDKRVLEAEEAGDAGDGSDKFLTDKLQDMEEVKEQSPLQFLVDMVPDNIFVSFGDNSLMLQVIVFAIFFGVTMLLIDRQKISAMENFINGGNEIFLKMVDIVMKGAPFFVFALLAGKISEMAGDNPEKVIEIFKSLSWYAGTLVIGLVFMILVFYPLIVRVFAKIKFGKFFRGIGPAQMLAFSTSSSVATLPVTMECTRDNLGVSEEVTSFVMPIGATVNMDGTSMYQAIAVVFLAQMHMVDLTLAQQLTIVLTATLASIGSAAVPSAGLIMMILVLGSVGLNPAWVAIIFPIDRPLDMLRTVVNVTGDATVASLVATSEGENLGKKN